MTYDAAGNLTHDTYTGAGNRTYDAENKITSAWGGNNQAQLYGYDASGQRIKRTVNGVETWQVYGFGGELLAEYPASGAATGPQKEYGYRNGQLLITASLPGSDHSLSTNGTSAYVQGPSSSSLSIAGAITVEAWIKIDSIGAYRTIISKEAFQQAGTGGGYRLAITDLGKVRLDLFQSHNTYNTAIGTATVTAGVWQHVAAVFDGSQVRLYLNGVLNGTLSTTSGPTAGTGSFYIGRFSYSLTPYYFNGLIDEVRVSNAALYTSNFTPANSLTASGSTKGLWKFNGQTTNDSSGNSNNGTLQGGAGYSGSVPGGGGSNLQLQWLVSDHLGTPRMILDQTGSLANMKRHDYLPFGEELIAPIGGRTTAQGYAGGDGVRQQFTSKERDVETGLDLLISRYYSSTQGRFTSADSMFGKRNNPQSLNRYTYVLNNPLRFVDPFGYQAQDPKTDEITRVIININDAEQQRRKKELEKRRAEGILDLPLIPTTMLHCITGACGNSLSIRQAAIGAATAVGNEAERIRHKVQTLIPDGVQLNVTALYLISVDATITPDLDYFGGIDMPILSGWTGVMTDATNGGTLTPRSGLGGSLTGIYIADPAARHLNGEARIGEPDAQNARRNYFNGTAYTAMGCYYLCGGAQTSSGKVATVVGAGTPGVFVGASQSWYLFQHPLAKLPNPFSLWRK